MDRSFLQRGVDAGLAQPRQRGGRARRDAGARGRRRGHRGARAGRDAARRSDATSGRASCSRGRWTPRTRWPSWPAGAPAPPMHHSYEGLDRAGGASRRGLLAPLRHRDFRLLWAGMCVSLLGDGAFIVALAWQVYQLSDAPDRDGHGRHRHDRADDRLPARRRRAERSPEPAPPHARGRRRAAARRRRARRAQPHRHARDLARRDPGRRLRHGPGVLRPGVRRHRPRPGARASSSRRPTRSTSSSGRSPCGWSARRSAGSSSASFGAGAAFALDAASFAVVRRRAAAHAPAGRGARGRPGRLGRSATCARAGASSASAAGSGSRSPARRSPTCSSWGRWRCSCRTWSSTTSARTASDLGLIFGAGGLASILTAVVARPARAAAPEHDVHLPRLDGRDAGGRRLRARHGRLAPHARERGLQRARDRRHDRLGHGQAAARAVGHARSRVQPRLADLDRPAARSRSP